METTGQVSLEQLQKEHGSYFRLVLEAQMYPEFLATTVEQERESFYKLNDIFDRILDTIVAERAEIKEQYAHDEDEMYFRSRCAFADGMLALSKVWYMQNGVASGDSLETAEMSVDSFATPANINWYTKVLSEWVDLAYTGATVTAPNNVPYDSAVAGVQASISYMQQPGAFSEDSFYGQPSDIDPQVLPLLIETQQKLIDMGCYTPNVKTQV